ncbi:NADH dehydrogenase [ubiquinone] 1 alpha subcomplex subunit 5-like [Homarus americanus]|nr:NADH dehydrogenase [ubiquinone] 1 alpha subcomplex subunit 5-like [Homarus americanus]
MAARKVTTGLTGLAVATNPHHTLGVLYGKIMRCLQKMPPDAAYRKYTEQIIGERSSLVKTETDVLKLEKAISGGQIEEVIQQAENELTLARKMLEWKPWEPLVQEPTPGQWKWPI